MRVNAKSLLIAIVVCSLAVAATPSMSPAAATSTDDDLASTTKVFCEDNSQDSDWTDGLLPRRKVMYGWVSVSSCP